MANEAAGSCEEKMAQGANEWKGGDPVARTSDVAGDKSQQAAAEQERHARENDYPEAAQDAANKT